MAAASLDLTMAIEVVALPRASPLPLCHPMRRPNRYGPALEWQCLKPPLPFGSYSSMRSVCPAPWKTSRTGLYPRR